jgi:hypothetical protein
MRGYLATVAVLVIGGFAESVQAATDTGDSVMSGAIRGGIIGGIVGGIAGAVVWAMKKNKK